MSLGLARTGRVLVAVAGDLRGPRRQRSQMLLPGDFAPYMANVSSGPRAKPIRRSIAMRTAATDGIRMRRPPIESG